LELLRHRPLSYRGKSTVQWRPVAIVLAFLVVAFFVVAIIQRVALSDAEHARLSRDRIACQANLAALRRKELVYVTIDKAARKLVSDPEHKSIETGLGPLVALLIANADVGLDADYQHVVLTLIQSAYDYRGGAATAEQVDQRADEFLVEGQKAAERTQTLIAAAVPQGC
jgi:Tfp pilus assembly protein PilX